MFARPGKQAEAKPAPSADPEDVLDLKLVLGSKPAAEEDAEGTIADAVTLSDAGTQAEKIDHELNGTIIREDTTLIGNMVSPRDVYVAGQITGDIACQRLVADSTARIRGGVIADEVVVDGSIDGPIRAYRVTLTANARVKGEVFYQSFSMEKGADFEGLARRSDKPKQFEHAKAATQNVANTATATPAAQVALTSAMTPAGSAAAVAPMTRPAPAQTVPAGYQQAPIRVAQLALKQAS